MVCLYSSIGCLLPSTAGKFKGKLQYSKLLHILMASHSINEEVAINLLITISYKTEQEEMVIKNWCHKSVITATLLRCPLATLLRYVCIQ